MRLRRSFLLALLSLPFARPAPVPLAAPLRAHPAETSRELTRRPNIVLIIADDMAGGLMGIDGDPRQATPNLDRLASQGTRFQRAYCNAPVCTASRQSLITGRMPHAVGVTQLMTPLPDSALTLGDWLSDLGYHTAAFGKMHFNGPAHHGFDVMVDTEEWFRHTKKHPPRGGGRRAPWRPFHDPSATWLNADSKPSGLPASAEEATYFIDRAAEYFHEHGDDPFFVVVAFHEPHAPFIFPRDWQGAYSPDQFETPDVSHDERRRCPRVFDDLDGEKARGIQAAYFSSVKWMDENVGRLLDRLDAEGLAEDTIVVFLSDNGYMLGQHGRFEKNCFYEPSVRVPLIVRWPGNIAAGRNVTEPVELVDVVPTVLDLSGQPRPPGTHGLNLAPMLLGGRETTGRDVVVSEYLENEEAMAVSRRYKLVIGSGRRYRRDGLDNGLPLTGPYLNLYDLEEDPGESRDLARDPAHQDVVRSLRKALLERLSRTREGLEPVPPWMDETDAILWCLVPRDCDLVDPHMTWLERWLR
jgi:choline-sulfatase